MGGKKKQNPKMRNCFIKQFDTILRLSVAVLQDLNFFGVRV